MAINIHEKFKDASPVQTVSKIREILANEGISVSETWFDSGVDMCYSVRVSMDGTGLGSNGKGITKELARASGYAEFIERLQSGFLTHKFTGLYYNDETKLTEKEFIYACGEIISQVSKHLDTYCPKGLSEQKVISKMMDMDGNNGTIKVAEYYDPIEGRSSYVPITFVNTVCGSNGLAAGNTVEEALVQGFSEIIERYSRTKLITEKMTPPTIPENHLKNFPIAYKIITDIKKAGYNVIVKDCSLGEGFPIIAVIFINKETHTYHVHMGASPVFEIALERSLTEVLQGRNVSKIAKIKDVIKPNDKLDMVNLKNAFINSESKYPLEFFGENPSYPFLPFADKSNRTNKELFSDILEYINNKGMKMYIRDLSCLGFNTFRVYIPGMSEILYTGLATDLPVYKLANTTKDFLKNIGTAPIDKLYEMLIFLKYKNNCEDITSFSRITNVLINNESSADKFLFFISLAYLCYELGSVNESYKYAAQAERYSWNSEISSYLSCLLKYNDMMLWGYDEREIWFFISNFYSEKSVENIKLIVADNTNPFKRFLMDCSEEKCNTCIYRQFCLKEVYEPITKLIYDKSARFDNEASFRRIRNVLK